MQSTELPESVTSINLDGRHIYLIGTAHVSRESVEDVRFTVKAVEPDAIAVELCAARYKTLMERDNWKRMDIFKVIKQKKAVLLLTQLVMAAFYRRLGEQLGVQPGAEMLEGINLAEETGAELVLADRDIDITFRRLWGYMCLWNKMKLLTHLIMSIFEREKIDAALVETLKHRDQLESIMAELAEQLPDIKKRLIDERDVFIAQKIRGARGHKIVAVVGAGHVPGITRHIQTEESIDHLNKIPRKTIWPTLLKWGLPALIIAILIYGFFQKGAAHSLESIAILIFATGTLSALGTAMALGHPLAILSAFFAAPIAALHPAIATGWVAGIVQALVRRPTVDDFEDLHNTVVSFKGFWTNPVTRILLVIALANLGTMIGLWISITWFIARSA